METDDCNAVDEEDLDDRLADRLLQVRPRLLMYACVTVVSDINNHVKYNEYYAQNTPQIMQMIK